MTETEATNQSNPTAVPPPKKSICKLCGKTFDNPQLLAAHKRMKHPGAPGQGHTKSAKTHPYRCDQCGARFEATKLLGAHRSKVHGILGMAKSTIANRARQKAAAKTVKCPECHKRFPDARLLGVHRKGQHGVTGTSRSAIEARENRMDQAPRDFKCPECGREFKNAMGLSIHLATIHNIRGNELKALKERQRANVNGNSTGATHGEDEVAIAFWVSQAVAELRNTWATYAARVELLPEDFASRVMAVVQGSSKTLRARYRLPS